MRPKGNRRSLKEWKEIEIYHRPSGAIKSPRGDVARSEGCNFSQRCIAQARTMIVPHRVYTNPTARGTISIRAALPSDAVHFFRRYGLTKLHRQLSSKRERNRSSTRERRFFFFSIEDTSDPRAGL